jgi:hypothetical protein
MLQGCLDADDTTTILSTIRRVTRLLGLRGINALKPDLLLDGVPVDDPGAT